MSILDKLFKNAKLYSKKEYLGNRQKEESIYFPKDSSIHNDIRLYYNDADGNECEKLIRDGEMWTTITGIRFRKDPERIMSEIYEGATVVLQPEPDNPVDPYAIAIYFRNELIGYVPKKDVPAILTCISAHGTEAKIGLIAPNFIRVVLNGTMEYMNSHTCLSRFKIKVVKNKDILEELDVAEKAADILEKSIESSADGRIRHEEQFEVEGDDEFDEDEMVEWEDYSLRIPFTYESEKQFMDIIHYLIAGKFMCFKGNEELGEGVYYCKKYDAYLRFKDLQMDTHIRLGNKAAFFIRGLDMSDRPKDIDLKIALNLY